MTSKQAVSFGEVIPIHVLIPDSRKLLRSTSPRSQDAASWNKSASEAEEPESRIQAQICSPQEAKSSELDLSTYLDLRIFTRRRPRSGPSSIGKISRVSEN